MISKFSELVFFITFIQELGLIKKISYFLKRYLRKISELFLRDGKTLSYSFDEKSESEDKNEFINKQL